jgi:acetylornithine deacetylase/succinyl-diaminopimelate desuccinylase-like protein
MILHEVFQRIGHDLGRSIEELSHFLRIPSISTYSQHREAIEEAAAWVAHQLRRLGFHPTLHTTTGHPVVIGTRRPHADRSTLLIYGHYDVQPPEPLAEWITPPFEPSVRDGYIYARGASDDKGQFFTYIKAMEAVLACDGELPINVVVLVEGEEEIGSPSLRPFLEAHRNELHATVAAISDTPQFDANTPAITYGLRGLSYLQIDVRGPRFDLHSGSFGGMVANPVQVLSTILARLKNADGRVTIPGFYDDVLPLEDWERSQMARLLFDADAVKAYLGIPEFYGETGYSPFERKTARPTLDVNGIWGGFSGEGAKTIIPAQAGAKVSMRLVPNQVSHKISRLFMDFVHAMAPPGVSVDITELHGSDPVLLARDLGSLHAASRSIEMAFEKPPVLIREGGSIPVVSLFREILHLDTLLLGWGCPDDGAHSPNERFRLQDFHRGIRAAAALLYELAA